jgi:hypothetical protein
MPRFHRRVATTAALLLVALPSLASAQYMPHARNRMPDPMPITPVSAPKVVLDKAKDFALTDSQRVQLGIIQRQLDSANAPFLARLDSIRPKSRPANGFDDLSQEQRDDLETRRTAMLAVIAQMQGNFATARQRTLALLAPKLHGRFAKVENEAGKKAREQAKRDLESQERFERPRGRNGMGNGLSRIATN